MGLSKLLLVGYVASSSMAAVVNRHKKGGLRGDGLYDSIFDEQPGGAPKEVTLPADVQDTAPLASEAQPALVEAEVAEVQKKYPYYHTTDQIHAELVALASRCPVMKLESHMAGDRSIDVVTIKQGEPQYKNFLLFGEHARELISPESGLHFAKTLCGETEDGKTRAAGILKDSQFQMIINGNPGSRKRVETGDYCLRVNPNGVDLNRNWDEEWNNEGFGDTFPGEGPFSEPETQLFKKLTTEYKPTNFLTVHSGTKGMYMPWAYDMHHLATRNQPAMLHILRSLDTDYCQCPFGAAGKEVGYSCPGTCLDWVYDKLKTPYAFAFEIYTAPEMDESLKERFDEKIQDGMGAFYQVNATLAHGHFKDLFANAPSDFVQLKSQKHKSMTQFECFSNFNPDTQERFDATVAKWSNAYMDMAEMVVQDMEKNKVQ